MGLVMFEGVATISHATTRRLADALGVPFIAGGAGFTDTLELAVLNHVMGKGTFTPNAQTWVGLSSTTPTDAGASFTEPSGGAYARVATQGTTATGAAWNTSTGTAPAYVDNSGVLTWVQASADWVAGANLTYFGGFTALTAGTLHWFGALTTPKPVLNGDTASIAAGGIRVQMGDPGRHVLMTFLGVRNATSTKADLTVTHASTFVPTDIAGCIGWWDPSNAGSITASGSPARVSQLNDLSGAGNHMVQATGTAQPTTGTRTQGGRNVLDYTNNSLFRSGLADTLPTTICAVLKSDDNSVTRIAWRGGASGNGCYFAAVTTTWEVGAGAAVAGPAKSVTPVRVVAKFNGASSELRVNGSVSTGDTGAVGISNGLYIGTDSFGNVWRGWIGEAVLYNSALSSTDMTTVDTYLSTRWGI